MKDKRDQSDNANNLPASTDTRAQEQNQPENARSNADRPDVRKTLWQRWKQVSINNKLNVLFTGAIATATIVYVVVSALQWCALRRGIEATERQSRVAQRAWLVGARTDFVQFEVGKIVKVRYDVKNNGITPAVNAVVEGSADHWLSNEAKPSKNEFRDKTPDGYGTAVRSGGGMSMVWDLFPLTKTTSEQIHAGQLNIRVYGKTFYDDVFGHHHWMTFCAEYDKESAGFAACDEGQEIDKDPE